ncbi:hypothetical protein K0B96_03445 [Horticoccus luteus]|uniref:Anti-sigma-K factor rskA n=1 Tax=Horticoccus luteus TaxID=2862869 RepID=A0A8F9XKH1_9BACT|nr:hypothetical protein [Horticoccus luteus]QYM79688.1 hypothetical protein K0B96_03445 [Horticoccus luteus]
MSEDLREEAFYYLLDALEPERRAAFEERLAREEMARAALRAVADGCAYFAGETAPAEAMAAADQRGVLMALRAETAPKPLAVVRSAPGRGGRWAWPLAAAVLLGLNAWQFFGGGAVVTTGRVGRGGKEAVGDRRKAGEDREALANGSATDGAARGRDARAGESGTGVGRDGGSAAKELQRLTTLRGDYAKLERASETLRAEYDDIIRRLAQRALVEHGVGRLAAMELVDPASYARGERKGLMDLARGILTQPGIVAVGPATTTPPPATPAPEAPEQKSVVVLPGEVASWGGQGVTAAVPLTTGGSTAVPVTPPMTTSPPPTATPESAGAPQSAYAWSVFDEAEHQGYLNLYHLPTVPEGQSLQLWVKPADSTIYERVGEVPAEFYGHSGSVYYQLPETSATPVEILVTQEPKGAPPEAPTGPEVLHGP